MKYSFFFFKQRATKVWLASNSDMKAMDDMSYIIRIKILTNHSKRVLNVLQEMCIKKVLEQFSMLNLKLINTPLTNNHALSLEGCWQIENNGSGCQLETLLLLVC